MTPRYEALEAAMESRRVELRMSWRDVSREAGLSYEGLRAIRRGDRNPNAVTKRGIEVALRWAPGSVDAILDGGEPTLTDTSAPTPSAPDDDLDAQLAEARALLRQAQEMLDRVSDRREAGGGRG